MKIALNLVAAAIASSVLPAAAQDTIKIGMNGALSGPAAVLGKDALAGLEMAVDEINAAGGIKGKKIELISKDDEAKPPVALKWVQQMVHSDKIVAYFPSTNSTPNLTSLQVTVPAGVPHIIAGTTSDVVCPPTGGGKPCDPNVVRLSILNSWQAAAIAKFAKEKLGAKSVAIMYDSTEYGHDGELLLEAELKKAGIPVVYKGTFDLSEKAFKPHLTKVKSAGADVILTWTLDFVVAKIAIEKKELGMNDVKIVGSSAITGMALRALGGDAVEGIYMADGMPAAVTSKDPEVIKLLERYRAKTKADPKVGIPYWTTTYYDAMKLLASSIDKVGTDRAALSKALSSAGSWKGTGVNYTLSPDKRNGRDGSSAVHIVQVKGGQLVDAQ